MLPGHPVFETDGQFLAMLKIAMCLWFLSGLPDLRAYRNSANRLRSQRQDREPGQVPARLMQPVGVLHQII